MKKLLILTILTICCGGAAAQKFTRAQFDGGRPEETFLRWFGEQFGSVDEPLLVRFEIDETGAVGDISNVSHSESALFDRVKQVLNSSPQWTPARKRKKTIGECYYLVRRRDSDSLRVVHIADSDTKQARFGAGRKGDEYGVSEFRAWVTRRLVYPPNALNRRIDGAVNIKFVIERDGQLKIAEIISSPHSLLTTEAVRVVYVSPRWTPSTVEGFPVRCFYAIPIVFLPKEQPKQPVNGGI